MITQWDAVLLALLNALQLALIAYLNIKLNEHRRNLQVIAKIAAKLLRDPDHIKP